jgi:hypothetical protein
MKFYVKNEFINVGKNVFPGDIVDIEPERIEGLKKANVLGDPVKEEITEEATTSQGEKQVKKSKPKRKKKS